MRLGLNLGYWGAGNDADNLALARGGRPARLRRLLGRRGLRLGRGDRARLGRRRRPQRIDVGSAVMQIPARTPAMTAMTAATLDSLSGGRFRLGLGVSGPQVSEGWHGVRFDRPLGRTREYVEIVRMALRRETVELRGRALHAAAARRARARRSSSPSTRCGPEIPIYLAAVGPEEPGADRGDRRRLARPSSSPPSTRALSPGPASAAARAAAGQGTPEDPLAGFDVVPTRPGRRSRTTSPPRPTRCAATPRSTSAAWAAGSRTSTTPSPVGWASTRPPQRVQDLYLDRKPRDAAAAVPRRVHRRHQPARPRRADPRPAASPTPRPA